MGASPMGSLSKKGKNTMNVKELIKELQKFDQELEVYVCDEIEGNDCELSFIEMGQVFPSVYYGPDGTSYTNENTKDVVMIRWCGPN